MNKSISLLRIFSILALSLAAMIFIFFEENNDTMAALALHILIDKGLGIGLCFYIGRLYKRWSRVDPWLKAYDKMCDEVMDKPNPSKL